MPAELLAQHTQQTQQGQIPTIITQCVLFLRIYMQYGQQQKRLPINSGFSIQQFRHYIIPTGTLNSTNVHRLTITTKVTVIYQYNYQYNQYNIIWDILLVGNM